MPPPSFTATSIAIWPSASIFLGADDGDAHCCVHDFVSELTSEGTPAAAFGDGGSVLLPTFTGSYATQVSVNGDGSLYSLGEYEGSGCGGPSIARVEPNGSLDRRFDASVARTIKTAVSKQERFTPTLVARPPSGAFALVGGLDRTCVPPTARMPGGGVVMAIQPSGRIGRDGKTSFSVPGYAFDSPAALRLASGQILAAASFTGRRRFGCSSGRSGPTARSTAASAGSASGRSTFRESRERPTRASRWCLPPAAAHGSW